MNRALDYFKEPPIQGPQSRKKYFSAFLVVASIVASGCTATSERATDAVKIVVEAEDFTSAMAWEVTEYYTGISATTGDSYDGANRLEYTLSVPVAGEYYMRVMAAHRSYPVDNSFARVRVGEKAFDIPLRDSRALMWSEPVPFQLDEEGALSITVEAVNSDTSIVYFDQLLITNEKNYQPEGYEYTADTVKTVLPPAWAFGVLYGGYTDQSATIKRVERLLKDNYPIDGYWIDSWFWDHGNKGNGPEGYLDFRGDRTAFPDPERMWTYFENNHIKGGIWVWDAIQDLGNEQVFNDFQEKGFFKKPPEINHNGWHNKESENTRIGDVDFSNPKAASHWTSQMKPFFDMGLDFVKLDRSSDIDYLKTLFQSTQNLGKETGGRGFIMSHLHSTYHPEMKKYPTKWSGDAKIAWEQPDYPNLGNYSMGGLRENILMVADPNRSTYEVPFLTNDLGGYNYFGSNDQSDSLFIRWTQFAMFNPITTVFSTADSPNGNMPYNFSEQAGEVFRYYANLKHQLFPYIYSYAHITRNTGQKMIRGDGKNTLQYQFGEEILVAPVLREVKKAVALPLGTWYDFYTDERIEGGEVNNFQTDIKRIPVFVKAGSILPMRSPTGHVETATNDLLILHLYPGDGYSSFTLYEDDGTSNDYLKGEVAETVLEMEQTPEGLNLLIQKVKGFYEGINVTRDYQLVVHNWNEVDIPDVEEEIFDAEKRTLKVRLENVDRNADFRISIPEN